MTEKIQLLQQDDVIKLKEEKTKWIMPHTTFTVSDFTGKLMEYCGDNEEFKKWSTGVETDVMMSGKSWQNGKVRLSIEFIPNELNQQNDIIEEKKVENIEHLKQDDIIKLKSSDSKWIMSHTTFTVKLLDYYTSSKEFKKWSTGVEADVMASNQSWQNGKVRLTIEFIPTQLNEDKSIELEQHKDLNDDIEFNLKELTEKFLK